MARLRPDQWADIRAAWIGTDKPIRELGREHGIADASIREKAAKEAWGPRNANGRKREIVVSTLAGIPQTSQQTSQCEDPDKAFQAEVDADVEVNRFAGALFVKILKRSDLMVDAATDGRELNAVTDAARKALDGYRRVRGLDEPQKAGDVVRPYGHMTDEELAREIRESEARQG